jgi:ABC-type Co2+ transport system permease subunit
MDKGAREERKNSERVLQMEREKRKGKIIGVVIAVAAIFSLSMIFSPIDIGMILGMAGVGIISFSFGAAVAALNFFPKFGQASITLGIILLGASLVLYIVATFFLTFDNSRLITS